MIITGLLRNLHLSLKLCFRRGKPLPLSANSFSQSFGKADSVSVGFVEFYANWNKLKDKNRYTINFILHKFEEVI